MIVTATTEQSAQVINYWGSYINGGQWYQRIALVGWISQNKSTLQTTLYLKWQIIQYNYYPYDNDSHTYTVDFGGTSRNWGFNISQSNSNGTRDATTAQSITVTHGSDGTYTGTLRAAGYKCWESFSEDTSVSFPAFDVSPEPEPVDPEPDPPAPLTFDDDPRFFIYADDQLVYGAGVEGYDVLNPKLNLEVNKAGSLTFDIPVGSVMYNSISKMKTIIEARQGNEVLFRGRLLNTKRNTLNTLSLYCEGFVSWLVDIVLTPYTQTNVQARDLLKQYLTWYNSRASSNRQITYKYSDISANVSIEAKDHSNVWNEIKSVLIDGVGGYVVPYLTAEETGIQWLSTYGATTTQLIKFGENLLDFDEYIDASDVFTAVRPYGKDIDGTRVSLSEEFVTNSDAMAIFGRIERTAFFDEITTESALRSAATNYLRTGLQTAMTMSIKAVDLHLINPNIDRIRLGDSVRVVSVPHGIDAYFLCTKIVYDFAHPKNTVYTFGATQRTISELTDASYKKFVITEGA